MMKSLLIDALRQAKDDKPGVTLSDSGSYDTRSAELLDTANDADALSLFETSAGLEVGKPAPSVSEPADKDSLPRSADVAIQENITSNVAASADTGASRAPALARWTPILCVVVAIVAAAGWSLYQEFQLRYGKSSLAAQVALAPAQSAGLTSSEADAEALIRFPFITVESGTTSEESSR
jgi:hypothetical protein